MLLHTQVYGTSPDSRRVWSVWGLGGLCFCCRYTHTHTQRARTHTHTHVCVYEREYVCVCWGGEYMFVWFVVCVRERECVCVYNVMHNTFDACTHTTHTHTNRGERSCR